MPIAREIVEAVRDRTDIVAVVGRHVQLQQKGRSWVGLCPLHQERTPSFNVVPDKGMYFCFGCQAGGDVFRFLMELEGLSFGEAVRELAGPAGVTIEERTLTPDERARLKQRATLRDVLEEATAWFHARLMTGPDGADARAYLEQRGVDTAVMTRWRLGWAPDGWSALSDHLRDQGYAPELIETAGLARSREGRAGIYDAFRARVIVPIADDRGRPIGFGGRLLAGDGPKYINTPETPLYDKGKVLFGLDRARRAIGQHGRVLLVEGYFDVISLHEAGFEEAIATCGTSLTAEHVRVLAKLARKLYVVTDADNAGITAALKVQERAADAQLASFRLELAGGKDPDEVLRAEGPEAVTRALDAAPTLLRWWCHTRLQREGYDPTTRERLLTEVADTLRDPGPAQIAELAGALRLDERLVRDKLAARRAAPPREPVQPGPPAGWRPTKDVTHLAWLLFHRHDRVAPLITSDPDVGAALPRLLAGHEVALPALARLIAGDKPATVAEEEPDAAVQRALRAVAGRTTLYAPEEAAAALVQVLHRLARPAAESRLAGLQASATEASRSGASEAAREALGARAVLTADLRRVDKALKSGDSTSAILEIARLALHCDIS